MSLHIRLTPEAQAILKKNKRNSSILSIIIAISVCAMIGTLLGIITLKDFFNNNQETIARTALPQQVEEPITEPEFTNQVKRKPSSPSSNIAKVITANTALPIAVPVPEMPVYDNAIDFGDADDFGAGWGSGSSAGNDTGGETGFSIPSTLSKRCSAEDRQERIRKQGGKKSFDTQVINALRYLQKTQSSDGSWKAQGKPVGMTSLALLAYLGLMSTLSLLMPLLNPTQCVVNLASPSHTSTKQFKMPLLILSSTSIPQEVGTIHMILQENAAVTPRLFAGTYKPSKLAN